MPRLPAERDKIVDHAGARNAGLRDHHAMAADHDVMADLHEIVDLGALADHRVAVGAAVDRRPGADLDIVLHDHATDLRHFEMAPRPHRETEAVLADVSAGVNDHAVADQRAKRPCSSAPTDAVAPDAHIGTDHRVGADHRARADLRARADDGAGVDDDAGAPAAPRDERSARGNADFAEGRSGPRAPGNSRVSTSANAR